MIRLLCDRIRRRLHDANWWVLHRTTHRYHMLDTGLDPGWHDEDTMILHACMAMLGRYIRSHGGIDSLAKFSEELRAEHDFMAEAGSQASDQDEAVAIWRWWTETRVVNEARMVVLLTLLYGNGFSMPRDQDLESEFRALGDKIAADEQSMLHRLVEIRPSLWK